jgi:hypothetical protein
LTEPTRAEKARENLVPGTIIKNVKGEYGVVLPDGRVMQISKEQAEYIAGQKLG